MSKTTIEDILTHHLTAFGNNDLEEILQDYTEDSQILTPAGVIKGLPAIRKFFEEFFAVIPTASTFKMKQKSIVDNVAYITWTSESAVAKIPFGTDSFFFEGNTIKYHTVGDYKVRK